MHTALGPERDPDGMFLSFSGPPVPPTFHLLPELLPAQPEQSPGRRDHEGLDKSGDRDRSCPTNSISPSLLLAFGQLTFSRFHQSSVRTQLSIKTACSRGLPTRPGAAQGHSGTDPMDLCLPALSQPPRGHHGARLSPARGIFYQLQEYRTQNSCSWIRAELRQKGLRSPLEPPGLSDALGDSETSDKVEAGQQS